MKDSVDCPKTNGFQVADFSTDENLSNKTFAEDVMPKVAKEKHFNDRSCQK